MKKYKCPHCGADVCKNDHFCMNCGYCLDKKPRKHIALKFPEIVFSKLSLSHILYFSLFIIAGILLIVGTFGDSFKDIQNINGQIVVTSYGTTYYFNGLWQTFSDPSSPGYAVDIFSRIIDFIAYFLSVIGTTFVIIAIIIIIKDGFVRKKDFSSKLPFFRIIALFYLPRLIITMLVNYLFIDAPEQSYALQGTYGWGSIVILVGILIAYIAESIQIYTNNVDSIASYIIGRLCAGLFLIASLYSFASLCEVHVNQITANMSPLRLLYLALTEEEVQVTDNTMTIVAIVLCLIGCIFSSVYFCFRNKSRLGRTLTTIVALIILIPTAILSMNAVSNFFIFTGINGSDVATFSKGSITGIVLLSAASILGLADVIYFYK